ncbi:cytochrome c [Cupriavidus pauculus]|uniref:Cytochrome c n=1 Tax=Cupriavidus pauculus TaxID=82633 RepID=A0A5P2H9G9_9BURK|nr:c-type cytochrome [Cupriavidus pauculus]QET04847.1 cytochrome c [Cupriavidus pauculus]
MQARRVLLLLFLIARCGFASADDGTRLARGKYLMESVVACANCHATRDPRDEGKFSRSLAGGRVIDEPPFRAVAPNITPDLETGIGKWTDEQIGKAIREGVRPDGTIIGPPMPIGFYRNLSDDDLAAIVAYLRAQPPVKHAVEKSTYRIPLPPNYGEPVGHVRAPSPKETIRYGKYLADIGHCMECHTPRGKDGQLVNRYVGAGGQVFNGAWGMSVSRNLTPDASGLKGWTDAQIAAAIRGTDRHGGHYKPPMAYTWYENISSADMRALIAYLRSLEPQPFAGER